MEILYESHEFIRRYCVPLRLKSTQSVGALCVRHGVIRLGRHTSNRLVIDYIVRLMHRESSARSQPQSNINGVDVNHWKMHSQEDTWISNVANETIWIVTNGEEYIIVQYNNVVFSSLNSGNQKPHLRRAHHTGTATNRMAPSSGLEAWDHHWEF